MRMGSLLRKVFDFSRRELPVAILLLLFFFVTMAVFQIVKPLKVALFLHQYGARVELYAKLGNILIALLAVALFQWLYNKLRRQRLMYALAGFFVVCFIVLWFGLGNPKAWSIWSFYFLGDLITTIMVTAFWAYATDLTSTSQAKRLFGIAGGGGVLGGWIGSTVAKLLGRNQTQTVLVISIGAMLALALIVFLTEFLVERDGAFRRWGAKSRKAAVAGEPKPSFLDGARLVFRSKYLLAIVAIMACYEIASQIMDFQFKSQSAALGGLEATRAFVTNVFFYANMLSVIVQFFLVSFIMRRFGLTVALLILPVAILGSSTGFLLVPTLLASGFLAISDNGLNYSIQQTARESLYSVTSRDEKYKARAFTNMFVQRLAKGIAIIGVLALGGVALRWLSLITLVVAGGMIGAGVYAGRRFAERAQDEEERREVA